MKKIHKSVDLKEHMALAGLIATDWSIIEDLIETTIWKILKLKPKYGRALTTHIGFVSQVNTLKLLLADKYPDSFNNDEWVAIANEIEKLRLHRNSIVHVRFDGFMMTPNKPNSVSWIGSEYKAKGTLGWKSVTYSVKKLEKVQKEMENFRNTLISYLKKNFSLSPLPYRPFSQQMLAFLRQHKKKKAQKRQQ